MLEIVKPLGTLTPLSCSVRSLDRMGPQSHHVAWTRPVFSSVKGDTSDSLKRAEHLQKVLSKWKPLEHSRELIKAYDS